jgi:hypothetical protein
MRPDALGAYGGFLILPIYMGTVALQKIEMEDHLPALHLSLA